ncbi:MAG: bifunctional UDP-N-acetylmuramoyl-tripeptide:D-alanyl-D-alanine ligase/alanine racemase [Parachlamydiaceae bacterium]
MDPFDLREWDGFKEAGGSLAEPAIIDQIIIDSRRVDSNQALFVALKGEHEDGHHYVQHAAAGGAKFALVSLDHQFSFPFPQKITLLRVRHPLKAFQSIAQTYRSHLSIKIIGITGSFGKTMVKDLLKLLLETHWKVAASPESFNSQIGVPLSLLTFKKEDQIGIVEAAISHPNEMDLLAKMIQPDYTLLTPTGNKHLATLKHPEILIEEMVKLIQATPSEGWSLLPNDPNLQKHLPHLKSSLFFWNQVYPQLPHVTPSCHSPLSHYLLSFPDDTSYQGAIHTGHAYFIDLLNMSIKAAWLLGISAANIRLILEKYQPEPSRTELWKTSLGTLFINDTYCSDPQSIDVVLKHFKQTLETSRKFFLFGGLRGDSLSQKIEYKRIGQSFAQSKVDDLLLIGSKEWKPLIEEIQAHPVKTTISIFNDYPSAFVYLKANLKPDDLIIFKGENKIPLDTLIETFNGSLTNNQCIINLTAIQNNLELIKSRLPKSTRVMVMVKALAYGTNDLRMSHFLTSHGIDILGVSSVDEAIALRRGGIHQSIFLIHAAPYEAKKVVKWDLEIGVSHKLGIDAIATEAAATQKKMKVHLHINTGMGRFGCRPEESVELARYIQSLSSLELEGVLTHFACSEDPKQDAFTFEQIKEFDDVIAEIEKEGILLKWKHAANSAGALRFSLPQYNMVRLGLAVYGLYGSEASREALPLRLAISLTSRIVEINRCKRGETVSYGRKYVVKRESEKIAILPIGYFDGLHRYYSEKTAVMINGQQASMVGNICMDNMMVDISDIPNAKIGDKVLFFGEDEYGHYLSPEELAASGGSIIHELMTCLGPRISRIFVYEEGQQVR